MHGRRLLTNSAWKHICHLPNKWFISLDIPIIATKVFTITTGVTTCTSIATINAWRYEAVTDKQKCETIKIFDAGIASGLRRGSTFKVIGYSVDDGGNHVQT